MTTAAEDIVKAEAESRRLERERREDLRHFHNRTHREQTTEQTPLDALISREELSDDEYDQTTELLGRFFQFLTAGGDDIWEMMRRLCLVGHHFGFPPFCHWSLRKKSELLNCSHGKLHWLLQRMINGLHRDQIRSIKAAGQKSFESRNRFSRAQQGNQNRKKK